MLPSIRCTAAYRRSTAHEYSGYTLTIPRSPILLDLRRSIPKNAASGLPTQSAAAPISGQKPEECRAQRLHPDTVRPRICRRSRKCRGAGPSFASPSPYQSSTSLIRGIRHTSHRCSSQVHTAAGRGSMCTKSLATLRSGSKSTWLPLA